jgi:hypothetical protein
MRPHKAARTHWLSWFAPGVVYFGVVFSAGFLFGMVRVLFTVPRLGDRIAELTEMPAMLLVIVGAASWVARRFHLPVTGCDRIAVGAIALTLMLVVEFGLVLRIRNLTLTEYFQTRDLVSGTAYYLMLVAFAVMPTFVERRMRTA